MADEALESAIRHITLDSIDARAIPVMAEFLREGFNDAREQGFPVHQFVREKLAAIIEREGLLDAWLGFIFLSIFAQGIAVGRGMAGGPGISTGLPGETPGKRKEEITVRDVRRARDSACFKWPDCNSMRLQEFSRALENAIDWYDAEGNQVAVRRVTV